MHTSGCPLCHRTFGTNREIAALVTEVRWLDQIGLAFSVVSRERCVYIFSSLNCFCFSMKHHASVCTCIHLNTDKNLETTTF